MEKGWWHEMDPWSLAIWKIALLLTGTINFLSNTVTDGGCFVVEGREKSVIQLELHCRWGRIKTMVSEGLIPVCWV